MGNENLFPLQKYLKYLGINWTKKTKDLYEDNFIERHSFFVDRKTNYRKNIDLFWVKLYSGLV